MKKYIISLVLFMCLASVTHAYLVFGNYDYDDVLNMGGGGVSYLHDTIPGNPSRGTRWAAYLNWGGGDILIDSVEIYARMYGGSSDNIHMYIYQWGGGGGVLAELNPVVNIGVAGNYMFTSTTPLTLEAGSYYLALEPDFIEGTGMSWYYALDDLGAEYSEAVGATWGPWQNSPNAGTYRVYGEVVPEPATVALFLLGASCLFARRKKN